MITILSTSSSEIFADFDSDMERDPLSYDVIKDINTEALKTSIRSILLTHKGTRRMQPTFGADLESKLFEPITTKSAQSIGELIVEQIEKWDPDIEIENVKIKVDADKHLYDVTIFFSAKSASIGTTNIRFILEQR